MSAGVRAELESLEVVFRALASAPRRHILLVLHFRGGEMTAGAISERFGCSWPTTSRHLSVLRKAGLVSVRKEGRERFYCLERERLKSVAGAWVQRLTHSDEATGSLAGRGTSDSPP